MKNYYVDNLGIVITEKCNLNCKSCFRGDKQYRDISEDVIDAIFLQVRVIDILNICGGEPTLALDRIEYLFQKIMKEKVFVSNICITINGTIYSAKLMELCQSMNDYIKKMNPKGGVLIYVSIDKYHLEEMKKRNISYQKENFYNNPYFAGIRKLDDNLKLFREGNAKNLDNNLTIPFRPMQTIILDCSKKCKLLTHKIGPYVTINIDGTITEDDTTYEDQEMLYNYGNIKKDDLVKTLLNNGAKMVTNEVQYQVLRRKELKRFLTYNQ